MLDIYCFHSFYIKNNIVASIIVQNTLSKSHIIFLREIGQSGNRKLKSMKTVKDFDPR